MLALSMCGFEIRIIPTFHIEGFGSTGTLPFESWKSIERALFALYENVINALNINLKM